MAQLDKKPKTPSKRPRVGDSTLPDLNYSWVLQDFRGTSEMATPFRPYGSPPAFSLEEYKDAFEA